MDGFIIYIVEKGLMEEDELGMEMLSQTTATGAMDIGTSGRVTGILMGRDKEEIKLSGWQRQKVTTTAHRPYSTGSPAHTQIP